MERQFTSGSRQAPDPFDQFLEEYNFYRKYTARDASCLFRVISEQMYDTQLHHLSIRKKCVRYMRKRRDYFQPLVAQDFEDYLDDLSKPKTYGTLIELQAVGFMFQRNVMLFEPYNLGNFYVNNPFYNGMFRVFYSAERHFDSVFVGDYIKDVAVCQSICYEILYKDVFKLPDVSFAVEQMLHASTLDDTSNYRTEYSEDGYCTRIHLADGRVFNFDLPQNTNCILENYKFCHFHYNNFMHDWRNELNVYNNSSLLPATSRNNGSGGDDGVVDLSWAVESVLPHKHSSCVRQLLKEGITPFPYKVAKALDPNMYRNIEFDAWNEIRKESFQTWYHGDSNFKSVRSHKKRLAKIFQVGAKCHVKLRKSENDLYTCHIQEIAMDKRYCLVFIEQLGEKHLVPYDSLTPLPQDQFQPWCLPYPFQRHMQKYSALHLTRHCNYRLKLNGQLAHRYCNSTATAYMPHIKSKHRDESEGMMESLKQHNACYYKLKQYTHLENFRTDMFEYCTMPFTVEHAPLEPEAKSLQRDANNDNLTRTPSHSSINSATAPGVTEAAATESRLESGCENCTVENTVSGALEHFEGEDGVLEGVHGVYMPEMHCFYPVHAYGNPEEYYSYVYDGGLHQSFLPSTSGNGGTVYYMCNPGLPSYPPTGYMQSSQLQGPHTLLTAVPPANAGQNYIPYYANPSFNGNAAIAALPCGAGPLGPPQNTTPSISERNLNESPNTSVARVNFDAKRSVEQNGIDLPTDVATLRYFFNLGLDYFRAKHRHEVQATSSTDSSIQDAHNLPVEMKKTQLNENGAQEDETKPDSNNNTISNVNVQPKANTQSSKIANSNAPNHTQSQSQTSNKSANQHNNPQRRFSGRYFNSKERQAYQRSQPTISNNGTNSSNRYKDHNTKSGRNSYQIAHATPNSSRNQNPILNDGKNSASTNVNANAYMSNGSNVGALSVAEAGIQTTPVTSFDGTPASAVNVSQGASNPYGGMHNAMLPYAACEYDGSMGALVSPPTAGGMYIQMPLTPGGPFGIYAAAGAPPPPQALGMMPTAGGVYAPYHHPPPSPAAPHPPGASNVHMPPTMTAGAPPQPNGNGFYAASAGSSDFSTDNGSDAMQLPCIGYPPMHFPFAPPPTPSGGNPNGAPNGMNSTVHGPPPPPPNNLAGPQGYWCVPTNAMHPLPSPLPTALPQLNGGPPPRGGMGPAAVVTTGAGNATNGKPN